MNVTREKIENRQVFLAIEMEPAEVEAALEKSYRRLVRKTPVPGFRKGKTPRAVLERYLGKESLLDDALNSLVPEAYQQAIKEQEIEPIAQPQIEITQTDPVVFKAVVSLRPTVELGDYQSIRAAPEPVVVSDDDVTAVIEQLRHQHATWEKMERPVEPGDLVVMDIQSSIDDRPYINQPEARFQVVTDAIFPAPGFSEHLLGMAGGIPVFAPVSSSCDFLIDGKTALLFKQGDASELTVKLRALLDDKRAGRELAQSALNYLGEHHSPAGMVSAVTRIYRQVVL